MTEQGSGSTLPRFPELEAEFEIVRELGRGGTAVVYLARDRELGRDVAIKLIRPSYLQDEEAIARLEREARTVGKLQHPNIVLLLGSRRLGKHGLALILQYVPGENLKECLRREGRLSVDRVRAILTDVTTGLAHAHRRRIVHRDIKPENVYLDEDAGVARLADFGIARAWDSDSGLTLPGTALGTPSYMSPEQVDGRDLDGRSDVYSLGLLAWEMLTGEAPWSGESLYNVIYKQKHERLRPVTEFRDDVPESLSAVLDRALEKDPEARWRSAAEFLEALGGEASAPSEKAGMAPALPVPPPPVALTHPSGTGPHPPGPGTQPTRAVTPAATSEPEARSSHRGWFIMATAALTLVVAALLLQGLDAPLQTLLRGEGSSSSTQELDWDRWERPTDAVDDENPEVVSTEPAPADAGAGDAPPAGSTLRIVQGGDQIGTTGALLGQSLVVVAEDPEGNRLPGVPVTVEVLEGGGTPPAPTATTDSQGIAVIQWRMGPEEGDQRVRIGFPGDESIPLEVSAVAQAPLPQVAVVPEGLAPQLPTAGGAAAEAPPMPGLDDPLPPALSPRAAVAGGSAHTCALDSGGRIRCWGSGDGGRLGLGDGTSREQPTLVPGTFTRVAVGLSHTCALDTNGAALCWGANNRGQLGDGSTQSRSEPTPVPGLPPLLEITAGAGHTCGMDTLGRAYCWGAGGQGQLGDGSASDRIEPTPVAGGRRFRQIAAGWEHTCAVDTQARAYCWGAGGQGQLGWVGVGSGAVPGSVQGSHRFTQIAAGNTHTCGVTTDGEVLCWGQGTAGQLGDGSPGTIRSTPTPIATEERFRSIAAGATHSCALATDSAVHCWGGNANGQLGDGTTQNRAEPTPVAGGYRFASLHGLGSHTCGLTSAGGLVCWGLNNDGQLGDGTRANRNTPTPVPGAN